MLSEGVGVPDEEGVGWGAGSGDVDESSLGVQAASVEASSSAAARSAEPATSDADVVREVGLVGAIALEASRHCTRAMYGSEGSKRCWFQGSK